MSRNRPRTHRGPSAHRRVVAALLVAGVVAALLPTAGVANARVLAPRARGVARAATHPKAPAARPSRAPTSARYAVSKVDPRGRAGATPSAPSSTTRALAASESASVASATTLAAAADTTAPSGPAAVTAQAQSISTISAQWEAAQDPESGIRSYVFAVGTNSTGTPTALANVRWWQVTYATNISVNLSLDPNLTYYVSVQATNGAGLTGPIVTSNPARPVWTPLGQAGNVMQLRLATSGLDLNGNPTAGWTAAQIDTMTSFFTRMYPILVHLYGPPADSYTVTAVRDLRYSRSNIFIPSLDEIHMDDGFSPQLFTHELVHAFRNDHLLSSDQSWNFDSTLSPFEESFAQAASYQAMNDYVAAYPNDSIVPGNTLYGSSNDWDYDFQNVPELRGTDLWSDGGGTGLYWLRYEMGAAALRKVALDATDFYAQFNAEYYRRINAAPTTVRPSRALIVDIMRTVVPTVEGVPTATWVDRQHIFYAQNVYGEKIFHRIQDYPATELFAFQDVYFLDTMACGSEWACFDGQQWVYHRLNGATGTARLRDAAGGTVWSGNLLISPTQNPPAYNGFGFARKSLTTATTTDPWPGGSPDDYVLNLRPFGLYTFQTTFTDPATQATTTNQVSRVLGSEIAGNFRGVWGGVPGHTTGTLYLDHEGMAGEAAIPVVNGAFQATRSWAGVANPRTGGRDSVPGRVFARFVDGQTGATYTAQRNIDYGSVNGNQMFLFDFTGPGTPSDTQAPTVSLTQPPAGAKVSNPVTVAASASDAVGVTRVDFLVDGSVVATDAGAPYSAGWNPATVALGSHTLSARAYDAAGNVGTAAGVAITVTDTTAPTVTVTSPTSGGTVPRSTTVTITATASDDRSVARVRFWVNNSQKCTDTTSPYSCAWAVGSSRGTKYTIRVRAYDASGNTAERSITVTSR